MSNFKKLNREEILDLIKKICSLEYKTEEQGADLMELLEFNVPDPYVSNLIYKHKPQLTPEQILEKALAYQPIILSGPVKKD